MTSSVAQKAFCNECGADVRDKTYFCYNCGSSVVSSDKVGESIKEVERNDETEFLPVQKPDMGLDVGTTGRSDAKSKAALDRLSEQISSDRESEDSSTIARAAARRRKARSVKKAGSEYVWEPTGDRLSRSLLISVAIIVLLSALTVLITVIWK